MKYEGMNKSQIAIIESELAYPGSAINTISLKLHLPECSPENVQQAVNKVVSASDSLRGKLTLKADLCSFSVSSEKPIPCKIRGKKSLERVKEIAEELDAEAIDITTALYEATVFPLEEGGSFLYIRFHHVVIDGYGMCLFAQYVMNVLEGKEIGNEINAPNTDDEEYINEDSEFWKDTFSGLDNIPSVFRDAPITNAVNVLNRDINEKSLSILNSYANKKGITVPYVLLAALALYISRATDKKQVVLLMTRLNRTPEQYKSIGCYTMLIPVVVNVDEEKSFADLCKQICDAGKAGSNHKQIGFRTISSIARDMLNLTGSLSEYVFNYYKFEYSTSLPFSVDFSVAGIMNNHATLTLFKNKNGRSCRLDYRSGIYTKEKAEFLFDALTKIISQAMQSGGDRPIREFGYLSNAEEQKLASITGKRIAIDEKATIPSLFRGVAFKYSDRMALYAGGRQYTFGELDELTDRIALGLIDRGVKPGDKVLFMLKRSYGLIPALLGISKAGAVFIPIDPAYPEERIKYIMENSGAQVMISSKDVDGSEKYDYIDIDGLMEGKPSAKAFPEILQESPAYMIYTSGTTGRPKGVILSHKGIANITHPDNNPFNRFITKNCKGIVAIGSICFDISLFEIFVPLFNGCYIELGTEKAMLDASELAKAIKAHGADMLHCTPSRVSAYLGNEEFKEALKGVKAMLMAGEVLPGKLVKLLESEYGIKAFNGYGPTETTIGATITEAGDTKTIGSPIANTGIVILNKNRTLLPYGATGEICVFGNGVGIGYQNLPEQTSDRFINYNGVRMYRTGDLGRFSEDGKILYEGRNDSQIKLRGLRIELSEIENMILSYPGVSQVACLVKEIDKTEHLVAFYTDVKGQFVDKDKLKTYLEGNLTRYMVPDVLTRLEEMPQTVVGKMDTKALKDYPIEYKKEYRAPETKIEKTVCEAFSEVLEKEKIGLDDSFFEIGGDSLKAASLMVLIEEKLQLKPGTLEFGDIYKYYTPSLISKQLSEHEKKDEEEGFNIEDLDYTGIDEFLEKHCSFDGKVEKLGTVLLTGATGYLGVHILAELIRRKDICDKVICIARPSKRLSAERRVASQLFYFEGFNLNDDIAEGRCTVLEGDITNPGLFSEQCGVKIDTILNTAANVSHFAYGNALEKVNVTGVCNLIAYAKEHGCSLFHVSTISVGGISADRNDKRVFTEKNLYIDQLIFNQYIYTKYMAEYYLLRAAVDDGLNIKIFRVGNLQGRRSDGEFQMNKKSNAFTRQLTSYLRLGCVPEAVYNAEVNFSPIDETARNIVALCTTGKNASVFHVSPIKGAKFEMIFASFEKCGYHTKVIGNDEFEELITGLRSNKEEYSKVEGLLTERPNSKYIDIPMDVSLTDGFLEKLDCGWLECTEEYLDIYAQALSALLEFM